MERVNSAYHSPRIPVPMNWGSSGTAFQNGGGTNPFSVTSQDPNTQKFPIWYATGRAGIDGNMTIGLTDGFTPPVSLVAWEWNPVAGKWIKLGAAAAQYETAFDATFTQNVFQASENAHVLIQSTAAITSPAYMDASVVPALVGPPQEG